jgi:hypothetical protein
MALQFYEGGGGVSLLAAAAAASSLFIESVIMGPRCANAIMGIRALHWKQQT